MRSSVTVRASTTIAFLAVTAFYLLALSGGLANAAEISGNATLTIGSGKSGKVLSGKTGKVSAIAPAKARKLRKKMTRVQAPVTSLTVAATSQASLAGGIRFKNGKRKVAITGLKLSISAKKTLIKGKLGGKKMTVFSANGKATTDLEGKTVKVDSARLALTNAASKKLGKALKLRKRPSGTVGKFGFSGKVKEVTPIDPCIADPTAEGCTPPPVVDPNYLALCGVEATSTVVPSRPTALALPDMTGAKTITGPATMDWGLKFGFRNYIKNTNMGTAQDSIFIALNGATRSAEASPIPGFTFPAGSGQYLAGDPVNTSDDKAVINGTGTTVYCNKAHGFWFEVSNPTVVIDGANSRIVADVASNESGVFTPVQRVDLADLNLAGITPSFDESGSEVNWGDVPAKLSAAAAPFATYAAGIELDPINVSLKTPYDTSDLTALANYVAGDLPFPLSDPVTGGCALPVPAGGSAALARTIDEHISFNGTASAWSTIAPPRPAAIPDLSASTPVTGGGLDWGIRSSLRSSTNAGGRFNLAGGATASAAYYGQGGSLPAATPGAYGVGLGAPGAFFSWPAASSAGFYDVNTGAADDDRLVLKTKGRVAICNDALTPGVMIYGTVLSNPTVVLDGTASRITVDVATRYRLSWVRATVDVASIDLTGVTPTGVTSKTWAVTTPGALKLTAGGESVLRMLGANYISGLPLDGVTVTAGL